MRGRKLLALAAALALAPAFAQAADTAGAPIGSQLTINGGSETVQRAPAVASNAFGGTVVVWQAVEVGSNPSQVRAHRYSATGVAFGAADTTIESGVDPAVAMSAAGGFAIVFNGTGGLRVAAFDTDGNELVTEAVDAGGLTGQPSIAMDADGNFVVPYLKAGKVVARRFNVSGAPVGDVVVSDEGANASAPVAAMSSNGHFLVAYVVTVSGVSTVKARFYGADGAPLTALFPVNTVTGPVSNVKAAMDGDGGATLAWSLDATHIHARAYDANGGALTADGEVANAALPGLTLGGVSMSALGDAVIAFDTRGGGGLQAQASDVFMRRYDRTHQPAGGPVQVNSTRPSNHQFAPSVALDADGDFIIVWQNGDTAAGANVQAQYFVGAENVDLSVSITDSPDPVQPSSALTYTYTISNAHPPQTPFANTGGLAVVNRAIGSAHNLLMSMTLPSGVSSVSASGTGWQCNVAGNPVACAFANLLAAGESAAVTVSMNSPASGTTLQSDALVFAYQFDNTSANNTDSETTAMAAAGPPTVQFLQSTQSAGEGAGTVQMTVTLSHATTAAVTVNFAAANTSTATANSDYVLPSSPLTIPAGATSANITVGIVDDAAVEPSETLVLTLSGPSANATLGATTTTDTLTITDNDVPSVQFELPADSRAEGAGALDVNVQLSEAGPQDATVAYTLSGSAVQGQDYTITPASPITIPAGETSVPLHIVLINNSVANPTRTLVLTLSNPSHATIGSQSSYTLSIVDDDAGAGGNTGTIDGASGRPVTFATNSGIFSALGTTAQPPQAAAGFDYPEGFFSYEISNVPAGGFVTLTVTLPEAEASDWLNCPGGISCYRVTNSDATTPGHMHINGSVVTVYIQDNGPGDDDQRVGFVSATVAPAKVSTNSSGALGWLTLLPLFGAAGWRRRRSR